MIMIYNTGWIIPTFMKFEDNGDLIISNVKEENVAMAASIQLSEESIDKMTDIAMEEVKSLTFLTEEDIDNVEMCVKDELIPHEIEVVKFPHNVPDQNIVKAFKELDQAREAEARYDMYDCESDECNIYHHICCGDNIDPKEDTGWWHRIIINPKNETKEE